MCNENIYKENKNIFCINYKYISSVSNVSFMLFKSPIITFFISFDGVYFPTPRSEEHTTELQSRFDHVCRLLLAKITLDKFSDETIVYEERLNDIFDKI